MELAIESDMYPISGLLRKSCHKKQENGEYYKNRELKNISKALLPLKGVLN